MMLDMKQLGESIVEVVKTFVAQQIGQVSKRIDALTERLESLPVPKDGIDGKDGLDGVDGTSVEPVEVEELVLRAVEALPPAKDGASVTVEDVAPLITAEVSKAVAAIPAPKDGKDAEPLDQAEVVKDVLAAIRVPQDGKSVTPAEVEPVLAAMVVAAVDALPRPKDGQSVPVDQVQRMIDDAVAKAVAAVPPARDGKDGEHGRDAAHIEILPAIDAEKSYPRGTYAKHAGGQWRSFETTVGMRGWECIQNGIAAIEFEEHEDGRTVTEKHILSDGTVHARVRTSREMKYRGVFRDGEEFAPGDTVTWGGSMWHCNEPTKDKPLDGSKAWTLAAKRGRDGKDGRDGIDMTKAVRLP